MKNIGNTCYVNSVLQCLFRLTSLNDVLDRVVVQNDTPERNFFHQFNDLRRLCLQGVQNGNSCLVAPNLFRQAVQTVASHKKQHEFCGREQNDAAEFMQFVLNVLHEAMATAVDFDGVDLEDPIALQCRETMKRLFSKECSDIIMLFYGMQLSTVGTSRTAEPFLFVDLPIPAGATRLEQCLAAYTAEEALDGWVNEATGKVEPATKTVRFWRVPPNLILVLKRFGADGRKIGTHVELPPKLACNNDEYTLQCVCAHQGSSLRSGHYVAKCQMADGGWAQIDDDVITPCSDVSRDAYMAIYCIA